MIIRPLTPGAYDDEEAAAHAYDLAALKYWGHDTILNFPVTFPFPSFPSSRFLQTFSATFRMFEFDLLMRF